MTFKVIERCVVCGGVLNLQDRYRKEIKMEKKDGSVTTVVRISEHWYCHNGHLRMKNYDEEPGLKVS